MSASAPPFARRAPLPRLLRRQSGLLIAILTFLAVLALLALKSAHGLGYYDLSSTASSAAALALAGMGEAIVVIAGGLDLSAGAVIALTNCLLAQHMQATPGSMLLWTALALAMGGAIGAINGMLTVLLRLQSVIVTLATMFIVGGVALLVLEQPGGQVPSGFSTFFTGNAIPGLLPAPVLVLAGAGALWSLIRRTGFGLNLYAAGSDAEAARMKGVPLRPVRIGAFVLAGVFYAGGGLLLTAQTGSGDPTVGGPLLLPVFVAVVLGGTSFAGGRGTPIGAIFGALTLMLVVNLLLVFNVPTYYASVVEGLLLVAAVLSQSLGGSSLVWPRLRGRWPHAGAGREVAGQATPVVPPPLRPDTSLPRAPIPRFFARNAGTLSFAAPVWAALLLTLIVMALLFGARVRPGAYLDSLLVLASFLAVLGLGQGAVVMSGGLDLSPPAIITAAGILLTSWASASNEAALWAVPAVLLAGALIGAINGIGIALFGIFPLIMTLAMNGIIAGLSLVYTNGTPSGSSPPAISWVMTGNWRGITPVVLLLILFVALATVLLSHTAYGRRLKAVGNSRTAAFFAGVPVSGTLIRTYMLSGLCSALVGIMLVGFSGQAFNDMGDPYLLPAIAVVVIGGTLMTGGRGHYLGMVGGALFLTALTTILTGLLLPAAFRSMIFGLVVLVAVLGLRERSQ